MQTPDELRGRVCTGGPAALPFHLSAGKAGEWLCLCLIQDGSWEQLACTFRGQVRAHRSPLEKSWHSGKTIYFSKAEKVQGSCPLRDHWSPGFLWRFPGSLDIVGSTTTRARCTGLGSGSAPLSKLRKKRCWRLGISWLLLFKSSTKLFMQIKQHLEWHFSL